MKSEIKVGFIQALGLVSYIFLVASFIQNLEKWLGHMNNFLAPVLFLSLLSTSILICGFVVGWYPIKLFWIKKEPQKAIKIVAYTTFFLFLFVITIFGALFFK